MDMIQLTLTLVIDQTGQLSCDVIGRLSVDSWAMILLAMKTRINIIHFGTFLFIVRQTTCVSVVQSILSLVVGFA